MGVIGRTDDHALDLRVVAALEEMAVNVREIKEVMDEQIVNANKPELASLQIIGASGSTIILAAVMLSYPPVDTNTVVGLVVTEIPKIKRTSKDAFPVSFVVNFEGYLELTYADLIVVGVQETFLIGPYDPAIKTVDGLWIAPAWMKIPD
jgi:hypothetical protein